MSLETFCTALQNSAQYPKSPTLVGHNDLFAYLNRQHEILQNDRLYLSDADEAQTVVATRQVRSRYEAPGEVYRLGRDEAIKSWLEGYTPKVEPVPEKLRMFLPRKDPQIRLIHLRATHSRAKLNITKRALNHILTYHQVMPEFVDVLCLLGRTKNDAPPEITTRPFHSRVSINESSSNAGIGELGRSGRVFQLCYALRDTHLRPGTSDWTIRPAVFYHKFDVDNGRNLWITAAGHYELENQIASFTVEVPSVLAQCCVSPTCSFRVALRLHILYAEWALTRWKTHIDWLDEEFIAKTEDTMRRYVQGPGPDVKNWDPNFLPQIQHLWENINAATIALAGNREVIESLLEPFVKVVKSPSLHAGSGCGADLAAFQDALREIGSAFDTQKRRAEHRLRLTEHRKALIAQNIQSQAADRTEKIARLAQQEAAFMRIIAILTLIYLPASFTSTFFSAGILHFEQPDYGGYTSFAALRLWGIVTGPFVFVTFVLAIVFYVRYSNV